LEFEACSLTCSSDFALLYSFYLASPLGDNIDAVVLFHFEDIVILLISAVLDNSSEFLFSIWPF
jgi:hypothetical protein